MSDKSNCCASAVTTEDKDFHYIFVCTKCGAPCNLQGEIIIPNVILRRTKPFEPIYPSDQIIHESKGPISEDKPNCKKHLDHVPNYKGTLEQLAKDIGDLKYNKLEELLGYLENKIRYDAERDKQAGRTQLSSRLEYAAGALLELRGQIERVCWICNPYMKKKA